jgi:2-hydroxy-6-oxonona-2,4-dienedioate hydrolase
MIAFPIQVNGILTRVLQDGAGDDPVVFIHGVGSRADRWARNLNLGPALKSFAIDLPGHGFAHKGGGFSYSVPGYIDFVDGFLGRFPDRKVVLVGSSLGGHIAAGLAARNPERVRHLFLVGPTGMFPLETLVTKAIAERIKDTSLSAIRAKLKVLLADDRNLTPELLAEEFEINNSPGAFDSFCALSDYFITGLNDDVVGEALAALGHALPVSLIWGAEDRSIPLDVGRRVAALLGDLPLHIIEGTGHAPYYEDPVSFNRILLSELSASAHQSHRSQP